MGVGMGIEGDSTNDNENEGNIEWFSSNVQEMVSLLEQVHATWRASVSVTAYAEAEAEAEQQARAVPLPNSTWLDIISGLEQDLQRLIPPWRWFDSGFLSLIL